MKTFFMWKFEIVVNILNWEILKCLHHEINPSLLIQSFNLEISQTKIFAVKMVNIKSQNKCFETERVQENGAGGERERKHKFRIAFPSLPILKHNSK